VSVVLLLDVLAASTAYVATRFRFRLGGHLVNLYMAGMMIPTILGVIPTFLVLKQFNLLNSLLGLGSSILPTVCRFRFSSCRAFSRRSPVKWRKLASSTGARSTGFSGASCCTWHGRHHYDQQFQFYCVLNEYVFALTYITNPRDRRSP
jgi:ABC-type glycerol-3-phosphate transport system permease component